MFAATDTAWAPWYVARTDDKKRGRLNLSHLLSQVPYKPLAHKDVTLPKRQPARGYVERTSRCTTSRRPERAPDPARRRAGRGGRPGRRRVVWRHGQGGGVEIVLVHRPADDDWSFPRASSTRARPRPRRRCANPGGDEPGLPAGP